MEAYPSSESCIYPVGVLGEGGRVHQNGSLEVTPTQIIYTPDSEQDSYIWPLRYLVRYKCELNKFTIEAGGQCPLGAGIYTFSTERAAELHQVVARNTNAEVMSPRHSTTSTTATPTTSAQTTSHRPPPSFPPPSPPPLSSSPFSSSSQRYNSSSGGTASPHSSHPHRRSGSSLSPSSSPTLSRSPSIRSLPENAFEVKNIGDDESTSQDGILEVTSQELIYTENSSQHRIVWPLMYLRRYGCEGNKFSIEAGRRCPGGAGFYAFSTPQIAELYELVQSYAKNLYSSQMSLCSIADYPSPSSSVSSPPSHNPQISYSQPHTPNPGSYSSGRSNSPVFSRSDSLIRRAFSASELRKNVFEVHNLGDHQEEVGKGILEVTGSDLVYIDSATGEKWRWPIKFLRRYGCNGVRVFSFEAGRRCPGGEGLYAFSTSRANEIHEAIVESINANRGGQMQQMGNLSMSRLSLAESAFTGSTRNGGWSRKSSVPIVSTSNHAHFLTPPPLRRPSQPTLDEIDPSPSSSYPPRTSTPTTTPTRRSLSSSDETDTIEEGRGSSQLTSPPPPPNHPPEEKPNNRSLSSKPSVQHTYDAPKEAKEEYLKSIENSTDFEGSKNGGGDLATKSSQKKKKAKPKPPPKPTELKKIQRSSVGSQLQNSPIHRLMNGYTTTTPMADSQSSNSIPNSPSDDSESSFYQNIQIRSLPKAKTNGMTSSSRSSNSFTDGSTHTRSSIVPQPSSGGTESASLYQNLSSLRRSGSDTPPSAAPPPTDGQRHQSMLYANLADFSAEIESGRSNSTSLDNRRSVGSIPSSPSTLASSSYAEVEIVHSVPPASPDSTAWSPPCSLSAGSRQRDSALTSSIGSNSGCGLLSSTSTTSSTAAGDGDVIYNDLNFALMTSLASMKRDKQTFADLLDRHTTSLARDTSGSKKKK